MKSIELTEEHMSKLIEMCQVLFPEYKYCRFVESKFSEYEEGKYEYLSFFNNMLFGITDTNVKIHWFEFCMTHLATILYNKLDSPQRGFTILYYRGMILQEADHPVNYLYEEFKKLK